MLRTTASVKNTRTGFHRSLYNTASKLVDWRRVSGRGLKNHSNSQLKLMFGANLNILVSSLTVYGRAENNLPKSFIALPKQLQGFTGFKTEIRVRNVLNFLSWTVYIWKKFRLKRFNFAYVYAAKVNKIFVPHFINRFVEGNA